MKLVFGRLISILLTVGGWVLFGIGRVLDLIGYATVPEDTEVAKTRLDQFLGFVLSMPWWAVLLFALISTLFLMWVSWPKVAAQTDLPDRSKRAISAKLKILFHKNEDPEELQSENIWRWFCYRSIGRDSSGKTRAISTQIVLTFDKDIPNLYKRVSCSNKNIIFNVIDSTNRTAIVTSEDDLDGAVVEFFFSKNPI